jgi:NADH-quinone oxidoreductase subunit F
MLIEGIIICSYAINSHDTYIYIRGEYTTQVKVLQAAIDEAYAAGYLGEKVADMISARCHRASGRRRLCLR